MSNENWYFQSYLICEEEFGSLRIAKWSENIWKYCWFAARCMQKTHICETDENKQQGEKHVMSKVAFDAVIINNNNNRSGIPWNGWISQLVSVTLVSVGVWRARAHLFASFCVALNDFVVSLDDSCFCCFRCFFFLCIAKELPQSHFQRFWLVLQQPPPLAFILFSDVHNCISECGHFES